MKRRYLLILILLIILTSVLVLADSENLIISLANINASAGSSNVSMPILLENNDTLYALQIDIAHSPLLSYKNFSLTSRTYSSIVQANEINGSVSIAGVFENGISPGNGTIMNLYFDISEDANGTYVLNSTDLSGINIDTLTYSVEFVPGTINVTN